MNVSAKDGKGGRKKSVMSGLDHSHVNVVT
jgi:hypothetical protein